jgi:DNA repair exonuclease SbcCD ATPase subunit
MDKIEAKRKAKQTIDELFIKIKELEERAKTADESRRAEFKQKVEDLKSKREDFKKKYEKLKNAGDESLVEIQKAFNDTAEILKKSLKEIRKRF